MLAERHLRVRGKPAGADSPSASGELGVLPRTQRMRPLHTQSVRPRARFIETSLKLVGVRPAGSGAGRGGSSGSGGSGSSDSGAGSGGSGRGSGSGSSGGIKVTDGSVSVLRLLCHDSPRGSISDDVWEQGAHTNVRRLQPHFSEVRGVAATYAAAMHRAHAHTQLAGVPHVRQVFQDAGWSSRAR